MSESAQISVQNSVQSEPDAKFLFLYLLSKMCMDSGSSEGSLHAGSSPVSCAKSRTLKASGFSNVRHKSRMILFDIVDKCSFFGIIFTSKYVGRHKGDTRETRNLLQTGQMGSTQRFNNSYYVSLFSCLFRQEGRRHVTVDHIVDFGTFPCHGMLIDLLQRCRRRVKYVVPLPKTSGCRAMLSIRKREIPQDY